jgi:hypothetical protein
VALGNSIRQAIGTAWRGMLGAVNSGKSAVGAVAEAVQNILPNTPPPSLLDTSVVDQLAGMANSWVNARQAYDALSPGDQIDASAVTLAPWSMDLNTFNAAPAYHVVVGFNVEGQGAPVFRTITGINNVDMTREEFDNLMLVNGQALSVGTTPGGGVGGVVTGVDSVTITVGPAGA